MNDRMRALVGAELPTIRPDDVPPAYLGIVEEGWIVAANGSHLLSALENGYSGSVGEFPDIVHFEASVNGRAMMDYDLPAAGPDRQSRLLRRSLAYACLALQRVPEGSEHPVLGYISFSEGGLADDTLTSHVTFCTRRPGVLPYVDRIQDYAEEALMEISKDDAVKFLGGYTG
ncbi:hypothetical protein [Streptomyces tricolor]